MSLSQLSETLFLTLLLSCRVLIFMHKGICLSGILGLMLVSPLDYELHRVEMKIADWTRIGTQMKEAIL